MFKIMVITFFTLLGILAHGQTRNPGDAETQFKAKELSDRNKAYLYFDQHRPVLFQCDKGRLDRQTGDLFSERARKELMEKTLKDLTKAGSQEVRSIMEAYKKAEKNLPPRTSLIITYKDDRIAEIESKAPKCRFEISNFNLKAVRPAVDDCLKIQERSQNENATTETLQTTIRDELGIDLHAANACCASACMEHLRNKMSIEAAAGATRGIFDKAPPAR